jgi:hypothetical protein
MNSQIDDLYRQARLDAGHEKGFEATVQDVYQRFAQLIVRECDRLNHRQSFELSGVVADSEHKDGPGFDSTCLDTVKRVEQYLHDSAFVRHFGFEPDTTKESTL